MSQDRVDVAGVGGVGEVVDVGVTGGVVLDQEHPLARPVANLLILETPVDPTTSATRASHSSRDHGVVWTACNSAAELDST